MTITNDLLKRIAFAVLGLSLIGYGYWLQSGGRNSASDKPTPVTNAAAGTTESRAPALVKVPIKDMRVGTRVPAFNPEVSAAERRMFTEPNWYQWMKLKLELPKPDGTLLEIEMLRPEDWVIEQVALVVEPRPAPWLRNSVLPTDEASSSLDAITLDDKSDLGQLHSESAFSPSSGSTAPLRPIYYHLAEMLYAAELDGDEVLGLVVELDLPELGISGPAWIIDLEPAPLVPAGPGQVVTATFKHASANVLDLVLTNTPPTSLNTSPSALSSPPSTLSSSPTDSIGVTANHPFWSVDRAEFVQAGELQIGERLQTLTGDIHWVQQKLPRPGPEPVYNLEVHAEHVYYVGTNGVLAHNAGTAYSRFAQLRSQVEALKEMGVSTRAARRSFFKGEQVAFYRHNGPLGSIDGVLQLGTDSLKSIVFSVRGRDTFGKLIGISGPPIKGGTGMRLLGQHRGLSENLARSFGLKNLELGGTAIVNEELFAVLTRLKFTNRLMFMKFLREDVPYFGKDFGL